MELGTAGHLQYRSTVGINMLVRIISGMSTTQLADRRSKCIRFIGVRRDFVLRMVTMTDKLRKRETGTDSANLLTSVMAVVSLHWENSSSPEPELPLELSFTKEIDASITAVITVKNIKLSYMGQEFYSCCAINLNFCHFVHLLVSISTMKKILNCEHSVH